MSLLSNYPPSSPLIDFSKFDENELDKWELFPVVDLVNPNHNIDQKYTFNLWVREVENPLERGRRDGVPPTTVGETVPRNINEKWLAPKSTYGSAHTGANFGASDFDPDAGLRSMSLVGSRPASILIGFDTEFVTIDDDFDGSAKHLGVQDTTEVKRVVLTYQFAFITPGSPDKLTLAIYIPCVPGSRISLLGALWGLVAHAGLANHPLVRSSAMKDGFDLFGLDELLRAEEARLARNKQQVEARTARYWGGMNAERWEKTLNFHPKYGGKEHRSFQRKVKAWFKRHAVPVTLISHYGNADLTTFRLVDGEPDILLQVIQAGGGWVSMESARAHRVSNNRKAVKAVTVNLRDSLSHAPAGKASLAALGASIGVPKLDVEQEYKSRMDLLLMDDPQGFIDYAVNDAVITLLYLGKLWGFGQVPPATVSAAGANVVREVAKAKWEIEGPGSGREFTRKFSGLVRKGEGRLTEKEKENSLVFYEKKHLEPVNGQAAMFMQFFSKAYHGGWNTSAEIGYFDHETFDVDAKNAYPTAQSCIFDMDWESPVGTYIQERELTLEDIPSPITPFVGEVRFEFPDDVAFPSLPVRADNTLFYPLSSSGSEEGHIYACGPEVYLALKLGAKVICYVGFVGNVMDDSQVLRQSAKLFIEDRELAKKRYGKGSVQEQTIKLMANGVYGKTAQSVAPKRRWNASDQVMDELPGSSITSPYHAAMTTSLVRAQLIAAANELVGKGYKFYSVTTDGFITDAPLDVVNSLGLYGIADVLKEAREFLTGDETVWEVKHSQKALLNLTTRGNVGIGSDLLDSSFDDDDNDQFVSGVLAKNGIKGPRNLSREEMSKWFFDMAISRTERYEDTFVSHPSTSELTRSGSDRKDFITTVRTAKRGMDFDLKRRPVKVVANTATTFSSNEDYEVATVTTGPWRTIDEAIDARAIAKDIRLSDSCLRTVDDWKVFSLVFEEDLTIAKASDRKSFWFSAMHYVRSEGLGSFLTDESLSVQKKMEILNGLVDEGVRFHRNYYSHSLNPDRLKNLLPREYVLDEIETLCSGVEAP